MNKTNNNTKILNNTIVAIDPGVRNISLCQRLADGRIGEWFVESIVPQSIKDCRKLPLRSLVRYMQEWLSRHKNLLESADVVLVEHQMKDRV